MARKKTPQFTFVLKLAGRLPTDVPMKHVGEYVKLFAELIGPVYEPSFVDVVAASTGVRAYVAHSHVKNAMHRISRARLGGSSRATGALRGIEALMGVDGYQSAAVNTDDGVVLIRLLPVIAPALDAAVVYQSGTIDGEVTGMLGSDDSMTLHLRDIDHNDVRLMVNDVALAKRILTYWRTGTVRVLVHGDWNRTDKGWQPDKTCIVDEFEPLDSAPLGKVLKAFANVRENGWKAVDDPMGEWKDLRGIS